MARFLNKPIPFPANLLSIENLSGLGNLLRLSGLPDVNFPVPDSSWVLWDIVQEHKPPVDPETHLSLLTKGLKKTASGRVKEWYVWDETQAQNNIRTERDPRWHVRRIRAQGTTASSEATKRLLEFYVDDHWEYQQAYSGQEPQCLF